MSGSRDSILSAIKANKPEEVALPEIDFGVLMSFGNLTEQYCEILLKIGGQFKLFNSLDEIKHTIEAEKNGALVIDTLNLSEEDRHNLYSKTSKELEKLDRVYIKGTVGVAENGAIWISENALPHRILPFITQHLVLVLNVKDIVPTLHHAYEKISFEDLGYGAFIAGPSKTADIEQSLVIGAHGARSLMVYLVQE
ncbi:LUD domain-containing protein [Pseudopedobacter sp.]|uniref:LutC/YkgG family protein n=1 Tax=Pseudopedobacter sp. TaxID=1936787 RepID=UPI0033412FFD